MGFEWESSDQNGDLMGFALGNTYIFVCVYIYNIIYVEDQWFPFNMIYFHAGFSASTLVYGRVLPKWGDEATL